MNGAGGQSRASGRRAWAASLAVALAALALGAPTAEATHFGMSPDPGGNEFTAVPVPPSDGACIHQAPLTASCKVWGINGTFIDMATHQSPEHYGHYTSRLGVNVAKMSLDWWRAQPVAPGNCDDNPNFVGPQCWIPRRWQVWDDAYAAARAQGITPVFILVVAPCWARDVPCTPFVDEGAVRAPPGAGYEDEWGRFAAEIANCYPHSALEIWNEPNKTAFWGGDPNPDRYAELLDAAYDAVQQVEAGTYPQTLDAPCEPKPRPPGLETPVVGPGITNNLGGPDAEEGTMTMQDFLDSAYAAPDPMKDNIDALSIHAFPFQEGFGANTLIGKTFELARAERTEAGDTKPIWITETGRGADFPGYTLSPFSEYQRAESMVRLYRRLLTMPDVGMALFHRLIEPRDYQPGQPEWAHAWLRYAPADEGAPGYPQVQAPGYPEPKVVFCAFSDLAEKTALMQGGDPATRFYPPCAGAKVNGGPAGPTGDNTPTFGFGTRYTEGKVCHSPDHVSAGYYIESCFIASYECAIAPATNPSPAYAPCTSPFTSPSTLADGAYTFRVRGVDLNGVSVPSPLPPGWPQPDPGVRSFTVDTVAPVAVIDSGPAEGSKTSDATPAFGFHAVGPGARFACSIDSTAQASFKACTSPHTTSLLASGPHAFRVIAYDDAGNFTVARRDFTVTLPDTVITKAKIAAARRRAVFKFAGSGGIAPLGFECKLDRGRYRPCSSPKRYKRVKPGRHTFSVRARDAAGVADRKPATKSFRMPRR